MSVLAPLVLLVGMAVTTTAALAQPAPAAESGGPVVRLEAGVALSSPLVVDGNGTRVRLSPAPLVGVSLAPPSWHGRGIQLAADARLSTAAVRLDDAGARWSGGRAWQVELLATGRLTRWARVTPRAGLGLGWIGGSDDVEIVRAMARRPRPLVEGGVELRRVAAARTALSLAAQGYRLSPPGGDAGGVLRLLLTVRHAW